MVPFSHGQWLASPCRECSRGPPVSLQACHVRRRGHHAPAVSQRHEQCSAVQSIAEPKMDCINSKRTRAQMATVISIPLPRTPIIFKRIVPKLGRAATGTVLYRCCWSGLGLHHGETFCRDASCAEMPRARRSLRAAGCSPAGHPPSKPGDGGRGTTVLLGGRTQRNGSPGCAASASKLSSPSPTRSAFGHAQRGPDRRTSTHGTRRKPDYDSAARPDSAMPPSDASDCEAGHVEAHLQRHHLAPSLPR